MGLKAKKSDRATALTEDDFWPMVIEFTLSQRAWWVGLCADFDLTAMQGHVLRILDPDKPVPMSFLADVLVCDASNVTGIVDKLESRGLIARQGAEGDRRIKMLAVSEKGRKMREQLSARMMEPPAFVKTMPADIRRRLAEMFHAIVLERNGSTT